MPTAPIRFDHRNLEALLWRSRRPAPDSPWHAHVAFAHWLVDVQRPNSIVDLGAGHGVAHAAFCHATAARGVFARCHAIDTWAEADGSAAHDSLLDFSNATYGFFSTILRLSKNEALGQFDAGSIDLLHLDGAVTYDRVCHHVETWRPKMSRRGVMLLHNSALRERGYGVWKLCDELAWRFPVFRFEHAAGLAVILVGRDQPSKLLDLCALSDEIEIARVRQNFHLFSQWARIAPE